jgi:hypothetical protein
MNPQATCPECHSLFDVEYVDNGVCLVWHGVHCGWGHQVHSDDVITATGTPAHAERLSGSYEADQANEDVWS